MYPMGGFESKQVITDAEENGIKLGFCSMPSDSKGNEINVQYATGWAMTKTSTNKDAAWQFLKECSFANDDMAKITARVGIPGNAKIAKNDYAKMSTGDVKFTNEYYVSHLSKAHLNPFGGTLAPVGTIWTSMVQEVTLNGKDPAQIVKTYAPKAASEFANFTFNKK
jgi:multiple sugar transport system substrate-binding protein